MTAEIAIMNREAIALASDSAVTMMGESEQKIFTSANKLFSLSKYHPVGIMIYGTATLMDVPWETIVKVYRKNLGTKKFNSLKEYADDFIAFLDDGNSLFPDFVQEEHLRDNIYAYFDYIRDNIMRNIHSKFDTDGELIETDIKPLITKIINEHYEKWNVTDNIPSIPKSFGAEIIDKYNKIIDEIIGEIFEQLPISKDQLEQLNVIAASLFSKFPDNIGYKDTSGIVIAGFGEDDAFPSLRSYHMEGVVNNRLKYEDYISSKIDFENSASINPFAQSEMVYTFMSGVDPDYSIIEEEYLAQIFNEYPEVVVENLDRYNDEEKDLLVDELIAINTEMFADLREKLTKLRHKMYIDPVMSVVSILPKDELALMAESLVNLTSFKRRVTLERETVGGPIDVAVISKGDGFIWIKRKHYFKGELNPQFFANYYKEV